MKKNKIFITLVHFVVFAVFLPMNECTKKRDSLPQISDSLISATQEIEGSTLYCYDGTVLVWQLETDYSQRGLEDTSTMLVVPVRLLVYDTSNNNVTKVFSDSGRTGEDLNEFFIWGNVDVRNWDGLRMQGNSLHWNKKERLVDSDDFVKITTPQGDVLKGKGLDASETFSWWTLRQNVSGKFPNFVTQVDTCE